MYSRAHLLIERDHERLLADKLLGIEACPVDASNLFEWSAKILGQKGTVWQGGIFRLYMHFNEFYNNVPPDVYFQTVPFHPNVDPVTGLSSVDILGDERKWNSEEHYFGHILLALQELLSAPCIEKAVNKEAADLLINSPESYYEMARQCVLASQTLEEKFCKEVSDEFKRPVELCDYRQKSPPGGLTFKRRVVKQKLPFEDYYATWSSIATSKSPKSTAGQSVSISKSSVLQSPVITYCRPSEFNPRESKTSEAVSSTLGKSEKWKKEEIERINQMKQIYLQQTTPLPKSLTEFTIPSQESNNVDELDREVNDLISWTDKLESS